MMWMVSARALCLPAMSMSNVLQSRKRTHLADGSAEAGVAILLVHVVVASTGLVADDETEDSDGLVWILLHLRES